MDNIKLSSKIEAILFYKNEPVSIKKLAHILDVSQEEIDFGLKTLEVDLEGRGFVLIRQDQDVTLATSSEVSTLVEKIAKDELSKEIGKAGLETLAIILYNNGASRREIDYVRGVNSTFILRNLSIRGLVDKLPHPKDPRGFLYKPSIDLLAHLGISKLEQLPEYESFRSKLETAREPLDNQTNE